MTCRSRKSFDLGCTPLWAVTQVAHLRRLLPICAHVQSKRRGRIGNTRLLRLRFAPSIWRWHVAGKIHRLPVYRGLSPKCAHSLSFFIYTYPSEPAFEIRNGGYFVPSIISHPVVCCFNSCCLFHVNPWHMSVRWRRPEDDAGDQLLFRSLGLSARARAFACLHETLQRLRRISPTLPAEVCPSLRGPPRSTAYNGLFSPYVSWLLPRWLGIKIKGESVSGRWQNMTVKEEQKRKGDAKKRTAESFLGALYY